MRKLIVLDPKKRLTAKQALEHPFVQVNVKLEVTVSTCKPLGE